jgi:GR25 family glycosyltransferase involved in LPS biosynthesis
MGFDTDWSRFLAHPAFLVNPDRRPDRLALATKALTEAAFPNQQRFVAVDGWTADLTAAFARHGMTRFSPHAPEFCASQGKQGCALSHLTLLRHIRDLDLPFVQIFEDEIAFHSDYARLGPQLLQAMPAEADMIYIGAQMEPSFGIESWPASFAQTVARGFGAGRGPHRIFGDLGSFPVYCRHAFSLTRVGVARLYDFLTKQQEGADTGHCMIIDANAARQARI